ncbi:MAG TPA: APC family permease [Ktedonobacteraceae bacterium]|jgi:amino acid transporter|nr:APC family permease [Ktedonobacteraceae bacterium]
MDTSIREVTTQATLEEKKKLRKEFRFFDMIFVTIAAIIGIDTLGAVSSNGGQALTWLLISAITFLIPYGLLTAELGSTFTQEGGVYEWCKLAGGRFFGALAAMLYWISNPLWVGGTLAVTAIAAIKTFWFGNPNFHFGGSVPVDAAVEIVIALIFIWGTTWCAIMSLRFGKWLSVFGSYAKFTLFALFVILALVYFFGGHSTGDHLTIADLKPTSDWGLIVSGILPVLIFNWVGFELQNGAGEEMEHPQRDVPRSLIRAGIVAVIAYAIPITVILFTLPKSQLSNAGGFLKAYQIVVGVLPSQVAAVLGWLVALAIILALASSGGTWIIGADRTYAIAALDRTAPVLLGRFSGRYGTPISVNTMSGIVASIAMIAAILVNSFGSGNIVTLYGLVFGFVVSTTTLSYLFIFPAYFILRLKYPNVPRPYKVPGGTVGAFIAMLLPLIYAAVASYFILIPTDATLTNDGVDRLTYELTQFVPLAVIVLLTVIFYVWGHAEKRNRDVVVELNLENAGEVALGGE